MVEAEWGIEKAGCSVKGHYRSKTRFGWSPRGREICGKAKTGDYIGMEHHVKAPERGEMISS